MTFTLLPTLEVMLALYSQPRGQARFKAYLQILHGNTNSDLVMPVSWYNPMAKEHVAERLLELQQLGAEEIIVQTCMQLNRSPDAGTAGGEYKVALNLADDLLGGWTNRYTTDFDSKFRLNALFNRRFCTPVCWSGEPFSEHLIKERTLEYGYRTLYRLQKPAPLSLAAIISQERFVAIRIPYPSPLPVIDLPFMNTFFETHKDTTDYSLIFNFLYGDAASASLSYPCYGITPPFAGFAFAQLTAPRSVAP